MREALLERYVQELRFFRDMGRRFAELHPDVADQLQLGPGRSEDPHVERLIEGFALIAARVHLKLEDDFPEVSEALLEMVAPHHVRPTPACAIAEFVPDPEQGRLTGAQRVPRNALLTTPPVKGTRVTFRTCFPTVVWPVQVAAAQWVAPEALRPPVRAGQAGAALRLELRCAPGLTFAALGCDTLRLHLAGEGGVPETLYELLCTSCTRVLVCEPGEGGRAVELPASAALRPVGFEEDEGLFPAPPRSHAAYALLHDYFAFPRKFLFLDLPAVGAAHAAGMGAAVEVVFLVDRFDRPERARQLATAVDERTVRLGCTPVVNLFPHTSEPILVSQRYTEYPLVPDARRRATIGVYSVDEVRAVTPGEREPVRLEPLYAHRHGAAAGAPRVRWYARRRAAVGGADGDTEVALSFVDPAGRLTRPDRDAVTAALTCHNGSLPSELRGAASGIELALQDGGAVRRISLLGDPTGLVPAPTGQSRLWRLVSQLSLNYLTLARDADDPEDPDDPGDPAPLRELLRLHIRRDDTAAERQVAAIVGVRGAPAYERVASAYGLAFARGRRIEVRFDEEAFAGAGVYLFASVLERFFAQYAALNSFTALTARSRQRTRPVGEWRPRAGCRILV